MGWSYEFSIKDSFAFGSLISTTDTVAVLSILKEMGADENLYALCFGESIFNDAIGIVAYQTVKGIGVGEEQTLFKVIMIGIGKFILIFFGSVVVGAMTALIVAFILKR
jgi:NhaP-type Na+/H+ or K+/H+ antiporter